MSDDDLSEIYPVRAVLEGLAARLAARHVTRPELKVLYDLHRQMQVLWKQREFARASRVHTRFNMRLYRASRNRRLIGILTQFNDYIEHTISRALALTDRAAEISREHEAILEAIAAGDGDAAATAARKHVTNAQRSFAALASKHSGGVTEGVSPRPSAHD
jgi:DNA-binding GntR family transcriptional regulator